MQEEMGCITLVVLFVGALIISLFFTGFGLIGEFYTDIVGSDGWNIFIVILSLICGYFVYHQASEDNNEQEESKMAILYNIKNIIRHFFM